MKAFYFIPFFLFNLFAYSQDIMSVNSKIGLNIREEPSLESKKIGRLKYLQKIEVLKETGEKELITEDGEELDGEWLKISTVQNDDIVMGYVFDGYLTEVKRKKKTSEWSTNDFIIYAPKNQKNNLKKDIERTKKQWKKVPNPLIVTYKGNEFEGYHHINFKDSKGKIYNFGFGENDFGDITLFFDDEDLTDNPKYLGKKFKIFWDWKISYFPCCSGDYKMAKAFLPSITKLEMIKK